MWPAWAQHGERVAIAGTACGERVRPSRTRRAADVADMGCGERAPPSRWAARQTCAAGVASSWPARTVAWRAGGHRGHGMRRAREAVAEGCMASSYRCEHGERTPLSRRAARRTCAASVASSWPVLCACTASAEGSMARAQGAATSAVAGTGCGECSRLVRRSARRVELPARRRWVS
jgi:hypothetical protein